MNIVTLKSDKNLTSLISFSIIIYCGGCKTIPNNTERKKELDQLRTQWRKKHRILGGRIILYPDKPPEHINARANKTYNWFWKNILLNLNQQDIPAIISNIKEQINAEKDPNKIRAYRTMIGMAEDAYQLKSLDEIMDYEPEILLSKKPVYNSEQGIIYKDGKMYTADYTEEETEIIIRDIEGVIIDMMRSSNTDKESTLKNIRNNNYKNWNYQEGN